MPSPCNHYMFKTLPGVAKSGHPCYFEGFFGVVLVGEAKRFQHVFCMFHCRTDAQIFPWKSGMKAFIVFQSEVEEGPITSAELEVKSLKVRDRELVRAKSLVFFGNDAY